MSSSLSKHIPCPTCKAPLVWDSKNPYRPFCSKRCRLIDLGAWADESYQIAETDTVSDVSSIQLDESSISSDSQNFWH